MGAMTLPPTAAPETGMWTRTIVPGLRHYKPRFAPGRLYDVPVRLGWRQEPLEETQLNPVPLVV